MKVLPKFHDIYRPGRIKKEWTRLAPDEGEQLHVARRDYSNSRVFVDSFQLHFNWKIWKGLFLPKKPFLDRWASCNVAVPFAYKLTYDYYGMGQNHFTFEFRLLNVVVLKWFRSRRVDSKVAVRFKKRYGKEVFRYAAIQVKDELEKESQSRSQTAQDHQQDR